MTLMRYVPPHWGRVFSTDVIGLLGLSGFTDTLIRTASDEKPRWGANIGSN